jgi:hypothetical protein
MNSVRLATLTLRAMSRYKLRSGFMMMGTFLGVAALIFVVSVGSGVEQRMLTTVRQLFSSSSLFVFSGGSIAGPGKKARG